MPPKSRPGSPRTPAAPEQGERIAKVLSRAGIASRREAERMVAAGEITVNGRVIDSPALNVTPQDRITVRGEPLAPPEPARLWLYHKPEGLVTSAADEKGRPTIFDALPPDMPRVMSVGRLDLNSEGLILLTNDGGLKRRLELPSTGWLRRYRVRIKGNPTDPDLEPLRKGIEVEGERFQPMSVVLDRLQGANAWLTVGLREGKNREIRRAMSAIGLTVNRLIRVGYGPFKLGELAPGAVEEVRPRVLRDQLGLSEPIEAARNPAPAAGAASARASAKGTRPAPAKGPRKPDDRRPAATEPPQGRTRTVVRRGSDTLDTQDPARAERRPKSAAGAQGGRPRDSQAQARSRSAAPAASAEKPVRRGTPLPAGQAAKGAPATARRSAAAKPAQAPAAARSDAPGQRPAPGKPAKALGKAPGTTPGKAPRPGAAPKQGTRPAAAPRSGAPKAPRNPRGR